MPTCTPAEFMILNLIYRQTVGFNRKETRLTYDDITARTGIKGRATISKATDGLETKGYIFRRGERRGAMRYRVNKDLTIEVKTSSEIELDDDRTSSEIELDEANLVQKLNCTNKDISKDNIKRQHDVAAAEKIFNPDELEDTDPELTAAMLLYKNNIGPVNSIISSDFSDLFADLSPPPGETKRDWIEYAVLTAAANGKNKWSYVKAIITGISNSGSLAQHKELWSNGQANGSAATKSNRGPGRETPGDGNRQKSGDGNSRSDIGRGQTPEMRAALEAIFARGRQ